MIVGKNVRYSLVDQKPLCSPSSKNCKESQLHSDTFSQHQVLHKWTPPFHQCLSMSNTQELSTAPVPRNVAFSNNHMQLVGLRNSNVEEQRKPQRGAFGGGKQDDPVSSHVATVDHHLSLEARLKNKFNTIRRGVMAMKPTTDVGDDDPYAFTDVDVKPADIKPTPNIGSASVVPPVAPVVNNCHWNDLLVKMATRVPSTSLSAPSGPTAIAKLYPELAEKLEHVRSSKSDNKVTKGSLNKSSRTMNRLQTKIAQNKLKDRLKRNKNRDRMIISRNSSQPVPPVISPTPFSSLLTRMEKTVSVGGPTNVLLNRTSGDSAMITTEQAASPSVANQLLCSQLTSYVLPQRIDVTASGDMPRHREIVPLVTNTGSTDLSERCRDSTPVGARKKKCTPNKRKSNTKSVGSQRRNHCVGWKKKLGTSDVSISNSLQEGTAVTSLSRQQLPLVTPPLPRPQLPIQNMPLSSCVSPAAGMDLTQTVPQPPLRLPAPVQCRQQVPLMSTPLVSSLPPLHLPLTPQFSPVTPTLLDTPLAYTCIRQRKNHQSDKCCKQIKGRLRDSNALDLYMRHTECRRRNDHVLPVGVDSSDEDSESNSDLEELPWQREWVVTSSDDDNDDDDLDYGIPSAIRHTKESLLRSKLRRQFLQLRRCRRSNTVVHGTHSKELQTFLLAARHGPASTANALLEMKRVPGVNQRKLKSRVKRAPLRRCLQKDDDDDKKTCGQIALPYANHCLKHIMYNVDQQMFGYCTAKFSDNTQCCVPVFDVKHELPLCPEHAAKADNYQKNQGVKPKKPRKKTKPSALTRPPKKGKKKKNQKKHPHPQKPSPPSEPPVSEASADLQSSFTVDVEGSSPGGFQSDELEKDVDETLEDSALDPDISDELGQSFSPGVIDKNLVLPLDSEQATRFLDEALDIFSGKNGEFLPSREEAEALEQALAVASEDIYAASESIEQMSQDSAVTMSMLTTDSGNEDELTKQIANSLMSPDLSSPNGSMGDDLASDNLSALANSISVADLKSLSQALTTSDLNSALDETPCGGPVVTSPYTVHTPVLKPAPLSNTRVASHMHRPPPLAPPGVMAPLENQGAIFLPIMSTALQQNTSVAPLNAAPFFIEHPPHHIVPPVYPVMPFPCGMMAMQHPDAGADHNLSHNGMIWSSLGGMERTAMPGVFHNSLPPMTAAFVSAESLPPLQGQQPRSGPKLTYPIQTAVPPGMALGPPRTTLANVAMARFSASQFTMAPPGGPQTQPAMAQQQPLARHSPQQQLYPNT